VRCPDCRNPITGLTDAEASEEETPSLDGFIVSDGTSSEESDGASDESSDDASSESSGDDAPVVPNNRPRRNVARVCYTEVDDDEETTWQKRTWAEAFGHDAQRIRLLDESSM
jgi:hypothetical protein